MTDAEIGKRLDDVQPDDDKAVWTSGHFCPTCKKLSLTQGYWTQHLFGKTTPYFCALCSDCRYVYTEPIAKVDMGDKWKTGIRGLGVIDVTPPKASLSVDAA